MRERLQQLIDTNEFEFLSTMSEEDIWKFTFAILYVFSERMDKWIPVSDRLPEDGTYIVTVERIEGTPRIDIKSFAKDLNKVDEFDFPKHKCGWYDYDSEYGYWEDDKVIAWMPLPKLYKAESEE